MNIEETSRVLAKAAAIDNRDVGQMAVMAWHEIIGDLDLAECLEAVARHRRDSPGIYLEPGHVRRIAKVIRDERRAGTVVKALPSGGTNPAGAAMVRQLLTELATKRSIPKEEAARRPPTREESIHDRALARARAERTTKGIRP